MFYTRHLIPIQWIIISLLQMKVIKTIKCKEFILVLANNGQVRVLHNWWANEPKKWLYFGCLMLPVWVILSRDPVTPAVCRGRYVTSWSPLDQTDSFLHNAHNCNECLPFIVNWGYELMYNLCNKYFDQGDINHTKWINFRSLSHFNIFLL